MTCSIFRDYWTNYVPTESLVSLSKKYKMAENDASHALELIQGFQRYQLFENRSHGSKVKDINAPT